MSAIVPFPRPDLEDIKTAIRDFQKEIVDTDPYTYMGAHTVDYGPESYVFVRGRGQLQLNADANRAISMEMAQSMLSVFGAQYPHTFPLEADPSAYWFLGQLGDNPEDSLTPINGPTMEFYKAFFALLKTNGFQFVNSVAYEILDFFMPDEWKQKNWKDQPALSGWFPPSSFIQPTNADALKYISNVQCQLLQAMDDAGLDLNFQIGEPWWWDGSYNTGEGKNAPCIYDIKTLEMYHAETGLYAPANRIKSIFDPVDEEQWPYIDWLRMKLGQSTNSIRDQVKARFPDARATLLFFTPQIMSPASELTYRLNFPIDQWVFPNYDFIQIEDYDWIIDGKLDLVPQTFEAATVLLGYPLEQVHYFIGFVLKPEDAKRIWPHINEAWNLAREAGIPYIYPWSYTQAMRDNIVVTSPKICGC